MIFWLDKSWGYTRSTFWSTDLGKAELITSEVFVGEKNIWHIEDEMEDVYIQYPTPWSERIVNAKVKVSQETGWLGNG